MAGFGDELTARLPEIVFSLLAAKQGGPMALGAFQGSLHQARQERDALNRQAALDDERRQQDAAQEARAHRAEQRAIDAVGRAEVDTQRRVVLEGQDRLDRFGEQAASLYGEPAAAENAILARAASLEGTLGIPQGQLSGFIPNMTPVITRGIRADARQLLTDAKDALKQYEGAVVNDATTSFKWENASPRVQSYLRQAGHPDGQPFKPSQLEAIAGTVDVTVPQANRVTYGELFPGARNTAQASIPVPMDGGRIDLNEASNVAVRLGWVADRTDAKQVKDAAIQALRDRLRYSMRNPMSGGAGASAIARQFTALGLDSQVEIDKAAREIAVEHLDRARSLDLIGPNAEVPTAEQIRQGFTLATDPTVRSRALENIQQVFPGPVGTREPVPNAVYDFVPGQGLVPSR